MSRKEEICVATFKKMYFLISVIDDFVVVVIEQSQ